MNFEANDDELVILAEDALDVKYLESLFAGTVKIVRETDYIRNGFHVTGERDFKIRIIKEE